MKKPKLYFDFWEFLGGVCIFAAGLATTAFFLAVGGFFVWAIIKLFHYL